MREQAIQDLLTDYHILRTSWVFGSHGENFVFSMKHLVEFRNTLCVVNDQFGRPTWNRTLAEFMIYLFLTNPRNGVYHFSNDNSCSWYVFAKEILKSDGVIINPISSSQFTKKAIRPQYSVKDLSKAKDIGFQIPTWQDTLTKMLKENIG